MVIYFNIFYSINFFEFNTKYIPLKTNKKNYINNLSFPITNFTVTNSTVTNSIYDKGKLFIVSHNFEHKDIFMNSASPGVISLFLSNSYYSSRNEYLDAISNAMKDEYEEIVKSGIKLQLDCPDLALCTIIPITLYDDDCCNEVSTSMSPI